MGQAEETRPISYLDFAIIRVALREAQRLVATGESVEEAVGLACSGAWSCMRGQVHARLCAEQIVFNRS